MLIITSWIHSSASPTRQVLLFIAVSVLLSSCLTTTDAFSVSTHTTTTTSITSTTTMTATTTTKKSTTILKPLVADQVTLEIKDPVDPKALEQAKAIVKELRTPIGEDAAGGGAVDALKLLTVATRLGDLSGDSSLEENGDKKDSYQQYMITKEACKTAFDELNNQERTALVNIHGRVQAFANMQRQSITDVEMNIPGGKAGHTVSPCRAAGCYAPGGRYPLPSSVIMTAVTARAAGCATVVLASPRPAKITLAAAHVANVDYFIGVGGAQAIAAMAYGIILLNDDDDDDDSNKMLIPRCDVICGPGNQWVTAAKSIVSGPCGIDMLAGPSEVLVICDDSANAEIVAADLIAQAEHDVVARAILLSTSSDIIGQVNEHLETQLASLPEPNKSTAQQALMQSFSVHCETMEQCIQISDDIAPEHLEIQTENSMDIAKQCQNYGGLFIGERAAEVLGDYGAGPNHTLPTGGTGRYTGGLSVFNFLRIRTWMRIDQANDSQDMVNDAIVMARLEGLEGHARAAETRSTSQTPAFKKPKA